MFKAEESDSWSFEYELTNTRQNAAGYKVAAVLFDETSGKAVDAVCVGLDNSKKPSIDSISIEPGHIELKKGESAYARAVVYPDGWEIYDSIEWVSSDENVASVSADGMITATGYGTAIITARSLKNPYATASMDVVVTRPAVTVSLNIKNNIIYRNTVAMIPVSMTNMMDVNGYQFDMTLSKGLTFDVDGSGFADAVADPKRAADYEITAQLRKDGTMRVIGHSPSNSIIPLSEGNIVYIPVKVSAETPQTATISVGRSIPTTL